jgi:hypothetical protein
MALSTYLAKVLGLVLIIVGAAILLRVRYFIDVVSAYAKERLTRLLMSVMQLMGGLFLVIGHNVWWPVPAAVITLLGWFAIAEALSYLLLPDQHVARMLAMVNKPPVYYAGGVLSILVGIYLADYGFALWPRLP